MGDATVPYRLLRYESRQQPLLSIAAFAKRLAASCGAATIVIGLSLGAGMIGYRWLEGMAWIDAFLNASMILSGMGPLTTMHTWGGKLFAGIYALYSGLALIMAFGLIFAPVLHRVLHRFHLETERREE